MIEEQTKEQKNQIDSVLGAETLDFKGMLENLIGSSEEESEESIES